MSFIHIVTLYSNAGADPMSPQDKLPIYRLAIESVQRGELIGRNCVSALRKEYRELDFSYDVRAIVFVTPETQIFEIVSEVLETDR